jgi:hypothetical protein
MNEVVVKRGRGEAHTALDILSHAIRDLRIKDITGGFR